MSAIAEPAPIVITDLEEAKEVYRQKSMRQGLYDAGEVVMSGVLVNLHGDEHRSRRRLENRLFRRETLAYYEDELFPAVIEETLAPHVAAGRAELVTLGHQLMMNLAALNAGVDRPLGTPEETFRLYQQMMKLIEGATLTHSTRDHAEVSAEVRSALEDFDAEFVTPSLNRRARLLESLARGEIGEEALPRDVLTVLLRNEDHLNLPRDVIVREIGFFLLAGAHTSATAFTRSTHNILRWLDQHPQDRPMVSDRAWVQRCVHETVRLNPSSPTGVRWALEDVVLKSGRTVPAGSQVVIDLVTVNRDPRIFGPDSEEFNPYRSVTVEGVGPYGLSFGHGMHACIGQELAAGVPADGDAQQHLYGLATMAVKALLESGVGPDPDESPVVDASTKRPYWSRYPVVFAP
ncbi:MAG: cytochrome P450 [Acidobacteriota bacterium]|nr:cytochrome P450 [Acidobacteriota bacterium]